MVTENNSKNPQEKKELCSIVAAVDKFLARAWGIEYITKSFVPQAEQVYTKEVDREMSTFIKAASLLKEHPNHLGLLTKTILHSLQEVERLQNSHIVETMRTGLFLSLFTFFEAFVGDLLCCLYMLKPDLFEALNRQLPFHEVLKCNDMESLRKMVLSKEIDAFRRQSYLEQFEDLEKRFKLRLRSFENWPEFVECSQRRNILAHCDGIVTDQYLQICSTVKYRFEQPVKLGDKLLADNIYIQKKIDLLREVSIKLAQTLWRKVIPNDMENADKHLIKTTYDFLSLENHEIAITIGEFGRALPRHASDTNKHMLLINTVIAMKLSGRNDNAQKLLESVDWSDKSYDFRLARAVLFEKFDDAADLMRRIGKEGDHIEQVAYSSWPLFKQFRQTEKFIQAYKDVYGCEFSDELQRIAESKKNESETKKLDSTESNEKK